MLRHGPGAHEDQHVPPVVGSGGSSSSQSSHSHGFPMFP